MGALKAIEEKLHDASSDMQREKCQQYFSTIPCPTCGGKRLKPEILAVTINGKSIFDVCNLSARDSLAFFKGLSFSGADERIAGPIVKEIIARLQFLVDVGLDYLTLERATATLSGGEAQRIRLATQIGAGLMGVLYILDEPSIGLHQRDNERLIATLQRLRDLGNTVIVVEHDEDTIRTADYVVDMGPWCRRATAVTLLPQAGLKTSWPILNRLPDNTFRARRKSPFRKNDATRRRARSSWSALPRTT